MIRSHVLVCGGAGCYSSGCRAVQDALASELKKRKLDKEVQMIVTGCMGPCDLGPVILIIHSPFVYQFFKSPQLSVKQINILPCKYWRFKSIFYRFQLIR